MTRRGRPLGLNPLRVLRALRQPGAPWGPKLVLVAALAYLLIPLDLVPDVPLLGFLDDLGVFALAWGAVSRMTVDEASSAAPPADPPA
jgi:uncharacterized membrane protein YkvA (DUF1232 family)